MIQFAALAPWLLGGSALGLAKTAFIDAPAREGEIRSEAARRRGAWITGAQPQKLSPAPDPIQNALTFGSAAVNMAAGLEQADIQNKLTKAMTDYYGRSRGGWLGDGGMAGLTQLKQPVFGGGLGGDPYGLSRQSGWWMS